MKKIKIIFLILLLGYIHLLIGCISSSNKTTKQIKLSPEIHTNARGLPNNYVTSLAVYGNQVWVGTKNGVAKFDGVNWQPYLKKSINALGSDIIESLHVSDNCLWISTDNGLTKYNGTNWQSVYTGGRARYTAVRQNQIAIATAHGIEYTSGGSFINLSKETASLVYDEVQCVAFDNNGRLWVGTRAGLALLDGITFKNFTGPAQQPMGGSLIEVPPNPPNCKLYGNNINVILPYRNKLAIGTTQGLTITDTQNEWAIYYGNHKMWVQKDNKIVEEEVSGNAPLPGASVISLAKTDDEKVLFVGTNKGLAILIDNSWLDVNKYFENLPTSHITSIAYHNGELWLGTQNGVYRYINAKDIIESGNNTPTKL